MLKHWQHLKGSMHWPRSYPLLRLTVYNSYLYFTVPAVLTVDNSVVDLETIEALYENVSMEKSLRHL